MYILSKKSYPASRPCRLTRADYPPAREQFQRTLLATIWERDLRAKFGRQGVSRGVTWEGSACLVGNAGSLITAGGWSPFWFVWARPAATGPLKLAPCLMPNPQASNGGVGVADGVGMGPREDCLGWAGQGKNLASLEKRKEKTVNACS